MTESFFAHETFLSPFTWRYGSEPMRVVWSDPVTNGACGDGYGWHWQKRKVKSGW